VTADEFLSLSDERDLWHRYLVNVGREAYEAGYRDGRADQAAADDRQWAAMPPLRVAIVPSWVETELRRYGLTETELARYAREHFGDVREDDYRGAA
jgi:hypothetical protein